VFSSLERFAAWTGWWLGWYESGIVVADVTVTRNGLYDSSLNVARGVYF
jgi:hypothetical protein